MIYALIILCVIIVTFIIVVMRRPDEFRVSRSATLDAPPSQVFAVVNDLHAWNSWSPWAKLDPNCQYHYEGPASGVGAKFSWKGNAKVGQGSMTVLEVIPDSLVRVELAFLKPFKATNTAEFVLEPAPEGKTEFTWSMYGKATFLSKAMGLIMDCEKMCGDQFSEGLANLNAVVRPPMKPAV